MVQARCVTVGAKQVPWSCNQQPESSAYAVHPKEDHRSTKAMLMSVLLLSKGNFVPSGLFKYTSDLIELV